MTPASSRPGAAGSNRPLFRVFDVIGETWPSMLVTRQGARMSKGWDVEAVQEAARVAAETAGRRSPSGDARKLIDEHRDEGRLLVMATTTPIDLVRPLADRLGFDDVIATPLRASATVASTGRIDGPFVWGKGKAAAPSTDWAATNDIDLVGELRLLRQLLRRSPAVDRRPPDRGQPRSPADRRSPRCGAGRSVHFDVPQGVPKFLGVEPQKALMLVAQPQLFPWVRFDLDGVDKVPDEGAAILVGNHRSYFDPARHRVTSSPDGVAPCGSSGRRRCSTRRWWET